MAESISGKKEEPALYDDPSVFVSVRAVQSKRTSESEENSRLRSEETQKDGYEAIGNLDTTSSLMNSINKKKSKTDQGKSRNKSKKGKGKEEISAKTAIPGHNEEMEEETSDEDEEEIKTAKSRTKSKKKDLSEKKSHKQTKKRIRYKQKSSKLWIAIATVLTLVSLIFCIYANLMAFTTVLDN